MAIMNNSFNFDWSRTKFNAKWALYYVLSVLQVWHKANQERKLYLSSTMKKNMKENSASFRMIS